MLPPLAGHDRHHCMGKVECRLEVDRYNGIPLQFRHPHHQAVTGNPGIVYQYVYPSEILMDTFYRIMGLLIVGSIRGIAAAFHPESPDLGDGIAEVIIFLKIRKCY